MESCPEHLSNCGNTEQSVAALYDRNRPTHLNEELGHRPFPDVQVITLSRFSVFQYIDRYLTSFNVVSFRRMWAYCDELEVQERLSERCATAFDG